jgi:5'-methylthioadenosine phosphorylase
MDAAITVAVIGGSGLYSLFDPAESETHRIETPYGPTEVTVGQLGGRRAAFLTRHGVSHSVAPHLINYRANIWALASLGVRVILSSSAVGGVTAEYAPGTFVLTDQFIDRTSGRPDTFFDEGSVQHLAAADPFAPELHHIAARALADEPMLAGETVKTSGTVVVIQGPRFSTRAESLWFAAAGAHTVNMTMYPEVPLAAELNIDTVNLSYVTDSDAGLAPHASDAHPSDESARNASTTTPHPSDPDPDAVSHQLVLRRLAAAQPRIVAAIAAIIRALPEGYSARQSIDPAEVEAVLARPVRAALTDLTDLTVVRGVTR